MPFLSDYSESFDGYYESPVNLILGEIRNQLDGEIYKAIQRVGVYVNKEELIKALAYDRGQYAKGYADAMKNAIPLDKLCNLLAEMYHCPSSGWPSNGHACHPSCPDETLEKLCGTDCENYSDAERWKAFLTKWMEELDAAEIMVQKT